MTRTVDMTSGKPLKLIVRFAYPAAAGSLLQQLYSLCDLIILGRSGGVAALAAVSSSGWLDYMCLGTVINLTMGFGIRMSHFFGAGDKKGLKKTVAQSVVLSVILSLALLILSQALLRPCLLLLNTPGETFALTEGYLRIIFGGIPLSMAYNLAAACLRAAGDSRTPLYAVIAASVCNLCLDLLFVAALRFGPAGAAAATVVSQGISAAVCLRAWMGVPGMRVSRADMKKDPGEMKKLLSLGLPSAFEVWVISFGGLIVNGAVNARGYIFMAGYNAPGRLQALMESVGNAVGGAVGTFTGQNYGAGRMDRVREGVGKSALTSVGLALAMAAVMLAAGKPLIRFFMVDAETLVEEVVTVGYRFVIVMSAALVSLYLLFVYRSALKGLGKVRASFASSVIEFAMRVSCVFLLPGLMGEWGLYIAEVMAWFGAYVLLYLAYRKNIKRMRAP